jgi:hypothetical protein
MISKKILYEELSDEMEFDCYALTGIREDMERIARDGGDITPEQAFQMKYLLSKVNNAVFCFWKYLKIVEDRC